MSQLRVPFVVWVAPAAVLAVTCATAAIWLVGPDPLRPFESPMLWPDQYRFAAWEPRDRWILLSWGAIAVTFGLLGVRAAKGPTATNFAKSMPSLSRWLWFGLSIGAFALVVTGALWSRDVTEYWSGLTLGTLAIGVLFAALLGLLLRQPRRAAVAFNLLILAAVSALLLPSMVETVGHMRDTYNFAFSGEELLAPSAGRYAFVNYVPQYVNLLGWLIAPIVLLLPTHASGVALFAIIAFQLACIGMLVRLVWHAAGPRFIPAAILVGTAPLMLVGWSGVQSPLTYFQVIPLRTVLPMVLIVISLPIMARWVASPNWIGPLFVGLIAGVVALNNADFGLPALGAVLVSWLVLWTGWKSISALAATVVGALVAPLSYWAVTLMLGDPADLSLYFLYAEVFAQAGFLMVPMEPFGWHVLIAALFITAGAIGVWLVRTAVSVGIKSRLNQGLALLLASAWSLMTLAYFAGRSLFPTMVGGLALQVGLVLALMVPIWSRALTSWRRNPESAGIAVVLGLLTFGWSVSLLSGANTPLRSAEIWYSSGNGSPAARNLPALEVLNLGVVDQPWLREAVDSSRLGQMLSFASGLQLEIGLPSALALNSPEPLGISPRLTSFACSEIPNSLDYVMISDIYVPYLSRTDECAESLSLDKIHELPTFTRSDGVTFSFVVIPLKNESI